MACNACWYLLARGDTRTAYDLAADLRQHWRDRLGDDDDYTQTITQLPCLGAARKWAATPKPATWTRTSWTARRRVLGDDHPSTLISASNLAIDLRELGELQAARDLDQDTLDPHAAGCWATTTPAPWGPPATSPPTCACWAKMQAARDLDQDTLDRKRRVLGDDHPRHPGLRP